MSSSQIKGDPLDFLECDTCRAKPGMPVLCESCLHNRHAIFVLKSDLESARFLNERLSNGNEVLASRFEDYVHTNEHRNKLAVIIYIVLLIALITAAYLTGQKSTRLQHNHTHTESSK